MIKTGIGVNEIDPSDIIAYTLLYIYFLITNKHTLSTSNYLPILLQLDFN